MPLGRIAIGRQCLTTTALAGLLVSACTQFQPYRTAIPAEPTGFRCVVPSTPETDRRKLELEGLLPCEEKGRDVADTLQHRFYTGSFKYDQGEDEADRGEYYLSFVEFDSQGWFAEREQMNALFRLLDQLEANNREVLVYVYAHGWKHNARSCDENIVCFSRLLERFDLVERKLFSEDPETQRAVVGVYLGWRGLPFGTPFNNLTFWTRKEAASRVGRGGVFELLVKLKSYRDRRREDHIEGRGHPTQLLITGHSFGGLVVYEALAHAMMERAASTTGDPPDVAQSFGDFVLLVNPAFEGSLYEPLFQIASHRKFPEGQRPVMMIVTSEADSATKRAFPLGRTLDTLFQHTDSPEQKESLRQTIGHNPRYVTHALVDPKPRERQPKDTSDCGCTYLASTTDWSQQPLLNLLNGNLAVEAGANDYSGEPTPEGADCSSTAIALKPVRSATPYPPHYPYLVVKTDETLIPNHNAIYEDRFTTFVQLFILTHVVIGSPVPAGGGCAGDTGDTKIR